MGNDELLITVTAKAGCGKTTLAEALRGFLREHGFLVTLADQEEPPANLRATMGARLERLSRQVDVKIVVVQAPIR